LEDIAGIKDGEAVVFKRGDACQARKKLAKNHQNIG
jgi:hypothetical protein